MVIKMGPEEFCDFLRNLDVSTILIEPKPSRDLLEKIFQSCQSAGRSHGLVKFRFVVIENEARELFGAALVEASHDPDEKTAYRLKALAFEAPQQLVLIVHIKDSANGSRAGNLEVLQNAFSFVHSFRLLARDHGYSTNWVTFNGVSDGAMRKLLHLDSTESMIGWLNIGSDALNQNRPGSFKLPTQQLTFLDH
jgi:nitroreductase